ncbi:hypothetical protein Tco_0084096, partial [Tanacetum coccineum]
AATVGKPASIEFKRISLTGFYSCISRSHYRSVLKQTTRISIVTVDTKKYHSDVLEIITRIMRRTLDNSL